MPWAWPDQHLSSSSGDPNIFLSSWGDGFSRLYDVRCPLPMLTFDFDGSGRHQGYRRVQAPVEPPFDQGEETDDECGDIETDEKEIYDENYDVYLPKKYIVERTIATTVSIQEIMCFVSASGSC
ncbi:hypothetical protein BDQ12DRAFT_481205 [Crucibulum laeve]|uniref:Uncharacterized protein n=1 Tax=Crucibulum laeve TaxID=68775 RepID=A0A5C3M6M1_9AGAR|nr:hypothetical protein BDQ12DRAFT_481205 [Crucibulum laeve]